MLEPLIIHFNHDAQFLYEGEMYPGNKPLAVKHIELAVAPFDPEDFPYFNDDDTIFYFETDSLSGYFAKRDVNTVLDTGEFTGHQLHSLFEAHVELPD